MSAVSPKKPLDILSGIRVLSFTQFLLGPAGVQYLADLGADVIKIEPPGRGAWERGWSGAKAFVNGVSVFYLLAHRNVRSLTLNLKDPEGLAIARKLVATADVIVQNFRPGVMARLGLDYESVRKINPRIIYVSASGYGEESPYAGLPGQDLLLQALSGLVTITGRAGEIPSPAGAAVVDQHAAALLAMGVLAALFHRERTGEGQKVEVTMLQAAFDLQLEPLTYYLNGGRLERPWTALGSTFHEGPYGIYQTRDGYVALSLSPVRDIWEALGRPPELSAYLDPADAFDRREEIYRVLSGFLRQRTTAEWLELFRPRGIWCAPVYGYAEALADPAVRAADPVIEVDHPEAGRIRLLRHPVRYSAGEATVRRPPPTLGQDTEAILRELGYTDADIRRLRQQGVV